MGRNILALALGVVGGLVGYLVFVALIGQGFYAIVLPGGLLGLSAGIVRTRSISVAVVCGFLAMIAGLVAEYRYAPFLVDDSLGYFFLHVSDLRPVTLILIGLGGIIGFWVPFRRRIKAG